MHASDREAAIVVQHRLCGIDHPVEQDVPLFPQHAVANLDADAATVEVERKLTLAKYLDFRIRIFHQRGMKVAGEGQQH